MRAWYFICMTVLAIGAAVWLARLRTQPASFDWLIAHGDFARFVGEYVEIEPVMLRWQKSVPDAAALATFVQVVRERPYAYLPPAAVKELAGQATDERIEARVSFVTAVLLSPCSTALKSRVLDDPLDLVGPMTGWIPSACTAAPPALFVCSMGGTKEAAVCTAEKTDRVLSSLAHQGLIGSFMGATTFLHSTNQLAARLGDLAHSLDTFRLVATVEHALDTRSLDRALFSHFFGIMGLMDGHTTMPDPISLQQQRLSARGLDPLVKHFFLRHQNGYLCVHRVMPAAGTTVADARHAIVPALEHAGISAVATSPEYVRHQFHSLVSAALCVVGLLWVAAVVLPLLGTTLHGLVLRVLLGRHAFAKTRTLHLAPGFRAALKACGLAEYIDLACIAAPTRRGAAAAYDMTVVRDGAHGAIPGMRTWLVHLPAHPSLPAAVRARGGCTLRITRAEGLRAATLHAAYRSLRHTWRHGIPVEPLVAFGDGIVDGRRCAVTAVLAMDGYLPFDQWQTRILALPETARAAQTIPVAADAARLVQRLHACGFRLPAPRDLSFLVGSGRVRLAALSGIVRVGAVRRLLEFVVPPLARMARQRDYRALNRLLFMELFSGRDRVRLYHLCENRARLDGCDTSFIHMMARGNDAHQYAQYVHCGDLAVNLAESARLARASAHSFSEYMALEGGRIVTRKRGRTVVTVDAGGETWYLKRHTARRLFDAMGRWREYGRVISHARAEWDANARLCALGIPVVPLLAMGEKVGAGSFIATAELPRGRSLEALLAAKPVLSPLARHGLARRIGVLACRLHNAGLVHRDFYLGHLYVVGELDGACRIHLLDAQRLRQGAVPGNRWSLKDLTALHFSSLALDAVRPTDRLRVLHHYFPGVSWRFVKPIARLIASKATRVARHTERLLARRKKRGELPTCNLTFITL